MSIAPKITALHDALRRAELNHAFGGAIALAYWTLEPRGTVDIDLNVFIGTDRIEELLGALPAKVSTSEARISALERDGQGRLDFDGTPVDIFLSYAHLHDQAEGNVQTVPFAGAEIPILGALELAIFKAAFDRTRDWADIEAMIRAETLDVGRLGQALEQMFGPGDPRSVKLATAVREAAADPEPPRIPD